MKYLSTSLQKLDDFKLDCLMDSALKNERVIVEASRPMNVSHRDVKNFLNAKKGIFTVSLVSLYSITKLSNAIYRIYFRSTFSRCKKLATNFSKRQCLIHYKIMAWKKTIEKLILARNDDNRKNINIRIRQINEKIRKLRSRQIKTGMTF